MLKKTIESEKDLKEKVAKSRRANNILKRILADKLYLVCFSITVLFFLVITTTKIHKDNLRIKSLNESPLIKQINSSTNNETEKITELDISDYVGIYSREIKMNTPVEVNELCQVDSYKYVYQIKSDKTINKYFYNSCIGSILIKSDKLNYVYYGGARYIGTTDMNFIFGLNILKEVDGYSYKIDEDIVVIREDKKIDDVELDFYSDNIVIMTYNNLYLLNDKEIKYQIPDEYQNNGGNLEKRFYKSEIKHQYNFITFKNGHQDICYNFPQSEEQTSEDAPQDLATDIAYGIYSVRYDVNTNKFMGIKEIVVRTKQESCLKYEEDLKLLVEQF